MHPRSRQRQLGLDTMVGRASTANANRFARQSINERIRCCENCVSPSEVSRVVG